MLSALVKFVVGIGKISVFIGHACGVLFFACILISTMEVVLRYAFDRPTTWSFEVVMALCATVWIMSIGYVTEKRRHIAITMLELVVSKRIWNILLLVQMIVAVFAIIMLLWALYNPVISALTHLERSGSAFNPALPAYLKTMLSVGGFLYLLQLSANIIIWFKKSNTENTNNEH